MHAAIPVAATGTVASAVAVGGGGAALGCMQHYASTADVDCLSFRFLSGFPCRRRQARPSSIHESRWTCVSAPVTVSVWGVSVDQARGRKHTRHTFHIRTDQRRRKEWQGNGEAKGREGRAWKGATRGAAAVATAKSWVCACVLERKGA